ncbi:UMP-CMP kinase [Xylariaceae sp. FL0662B]|nr:UMP-CMP kinase [Xylariaceae sp. FL0662B]
MRFRGPAAPTPTPALFSLSSPSFRGPGRTYSTQSPKGPNDTKIKFWPFLVIIALGSAGYAILMPAIDALKDRTTPTFSPDDVTVIFVLGGPGAGKGTQSERLVRDYGYTHLSAGDLLRAEQARPDSEYGELIKEHIKNGQIVPMEVTIALLENAMKAVLDEKNQNSNTTTTNSTTNSTTNNTTSNETKKTKGKFLIDGFPRKFDQAVKFEEAVVPARFVLFYDCSEAEMERRLLRRGQTSGRADDNADSIRKRFRTFVDTSMPVVDYFDKQGRVVRVDAQHDPDAVYERTKAELASRLGADL